VNIDNIEGIIKRRWCWVTTRVCYTPHENLLAKFNV